MTTLLLFKIRCEKIWTSQLASTCHFMRGECCFLLCIARLCITGFAGTQGYVSISNIRFDTFHDETDFHKSCTCVLQIMNKHSLISGTHGRMLFCVSLVGFSLTACLACDWVLSYSYSLSQLDRFVVALASHSSAINCQCQQSKNSAANYALHKHHINIELL